VTDWVRRGAHNSGFVIRRAKQTMKEEP
jgi:hypothetical protein